VIVGDQPTAMPQRVEPNHASPGASGPEPSNLDRAAILAAIDAATRRGDVDEASALLAQLMAPAPVENQEHAGTEAQ